MGYGNAYGGKKKKVKKPKAIKHAVTASGKRRKTTRNA